MPSELEPGSPLARVVLRAGRAFAESDVAAVDSAYQEAVAMAAGHDVRAELAVDHVARLLDLAEPSLAIRRCDHHLATDLAGPGLLLVRAQAHSSVGSHRLAAADAEAALADRTWSPGANQRARLRRVLGLAAFDRGDVDEAEKQLTQARRLFQEDGDHTGAALVDRDRLVLAAGLGEQDAVSALLAARPARSAAGHLQLAMALKREMRYESAIRVLRAIPDHVDPALRLSVLSQLTVLLRMTYQDAAARELQPRLRDAVAEAPDQVTARQLLARISPGAGPAGPVPEPVWAAVQHARLLIEADRLAEAETVLVDLRDRVRGHRDGASWHLAAGELELARHGHLREPEVLHQAVKHLTRAAVRASSTALVEVRFRALRLLGRARADLGEHDLASRCWAQAHWLEEHRAARQDSDGVRVRMLEQAADEHDERIRAATRACEDNPEAVASVVVAMEAARGAAILAGMLPGGGRTRDLPPPGDLDGAWRWVRTVTRDLPRSQVVWLMYVTEDRLHHVILGRKLLRHLHVEADRGLLTDSIENFLACLQESLLEASVEGGEFDEYLAGIADQLAVSQVVDLVPAEADRIAVVAAGALSEVPLAAIRLPGDPDRRLVHRFALSDLPCLSARAPLRLRAAHRRGDRALLVRSPGRDLTAAAGPRNPPALETPGEVRARAALRLDAMIRIDCHGSHDLSDVEHSWLQLAPAGPAGQLRPEAVRDLDLHGCGTLVLGACESGMAQRAGRDERLGFVRAALHAGTASAVAARWIAADVVAAAVLDAFEDHVRWLPRDRALRLAQLEGCRKAQGLLPDPAHPARWACWTLYGDPGWQTSAGPLRRLLRRRMAPRRLRAPVR
ncbi:CHAT domain-containing protein [Amycolatopsis sp. NBC_00345]|uniref:CHAT domain-containing protein n=1 Tax=Amycolatopsis sp. NBC_00345 TaxID=2975955 RepID=UPI002E254FC3